MGKRRVAVIILLGVLLLSACSRNYYSRVHITDVGQDDPKNPARIAATQAGRNDGPTAIFVIDPSDGVGYLVVTTGAANQLKQHLKIAGGEYDRATRQFTLLVTRFMPGMGPGVSTDGHDWQLAVRFRKFNFEKIKVVVNVEGDEDGSEQAIYDLIVYPENR